jgi:hypothetical protein
MRIKKWEDDLVWGCPKSDLLFDIKLKIASLSRKAGSFAMNCIKSQANFG